MLPEMRAEGVARDGRLTMFGLLLLLELLLELLCALHHAPTAHWPRRAAARHCKGLWWGEGERLSAQDRERAAP